MKLPYVEIAGTVYLPASFCEQMMEAHHRELAATVRANKDTIEHLMREVKRLRCENMHLRQYSGFPGGEEARVI